MTRESGREPIPDLTLERYRLGELPDREMTALGRRVEEDPGTRERLRALDLSDRQLRQSHPPEQMAREIEARLETLRPREVRRWAPVAPLWPLPAAVAAVAFLALALAPTIFVSDRPVPGQPAEDVRVKGLKPHLTLYRKTAKGTEVLADGARVSRGDLVRVAYQAAGREYGVILSVDGRGVVTRHLPQAGETAARLDGGGEMLLEFAYELDDAPRWERFYLVTGDSPFQIGPVVRAAERTAIQGTVDEPPSLDLPAGIEQSVISLEKGAEP